MKAFKKIKNKKKKMLYFTFLILVAIAIKQPRAVLAADLVEDTFAAAAANSTLANSTTPNCFKPSKMVSAGLALTGLKTAFNPCEPFHKRVLSSVKVSCIMSGLTSGAISEMSCEYARLHALSSYVCWTSWSAHVALLQYEKRFN